MNGFVTLEMTQLALGEIAKYPAAAFDVVAAEGSTTLIANGLFTRGQKLPHLPGGWRLQMFLKGGKVPASRNGEEAEGKVILFYSDMRTQKIWHQGQVKLALNAGFSEVHANAWARSKVPYKHDNIEQLAMVMRKPRRIEAYLKWPGSKASPDTIAAWQKEYSVKDTLMPQRRDTLAALVNDLVHGVEEEKPKIISSALEQAMAKIASQQEATKAVADTTVSAEEHDDANVEDQGTVTDADIDAAINGDVVAAAGEEEHVAETEGAVLEEATADQQPQQ